MAHISSIGAGIFTDLAFNVDPQTALPASPELGASWAAFFGTELALGSPGTAGTDEFYRIVNVREFPAVGTPANIVNVPVYGQKTSSQVQGQADAPTLEITLNYIGSHWEDTANYLGSYVGDGLQYYFRLAILNAEPDGYESDATGLNTVQNSSYFWLGKLEAFSVSPQLTDANQATLTISTQSDFYGAFTAPSA